MIQIHTLEPLRNWTRRTYQFLDEKVVIKTKSLTVDYKNEIKYQEIKAIHRRKISQQNGIWIGFLLIGTLSVLNWILNITCCNSATFLLIRQIGTIVGLLSFLSVFYVVEHVGFLDRDRNYLGYIPINKKNRGQVQEAIQLVRQKTEIISETNLVNPQTGKPVHFELTHWDIPDMLNKSVTNFYGECLVDTEKSLTEQLVTEVKYSELSGKTQVIKKGNESWDVAFSYWLVFWVLISNFFFVFFPKIFKSSPEIQYLFWGSLLMFLPIYLMKFVKHEAIVFYNTNDKIIYWTWISAKNREKIKQIVAFIQQKTGYNPEPD
jgi:hypothetical protein